jgi:hypothetical protein
MKSRFDATAVELIFCFLTWTLERFGRDLKFGGGRGGKRRELRVYMEVFGVRSDEVICWKFGRRF